jgi:predicted acylesterase/phospholipase RssA
MAKALILSGGGAKGAFSIGALKVLQERRGGLDFDIISGTSTGSLIAALLAADRLDLLRKIYLNVDNTSIVNPQNIVANIRNDIPYLISDAPLRTIIDREIDQNVATAILNSNVTLLLTAVSLQTGKITVFSNYEIIPSTQSRYNFRHLKNRKDLLNALSASSNQFAFLPPIPINVGGTKAEQLIDGGVRDTIPSRAVFELEPDPEEIVVISNNPIALFPVTKDYKSPIDILMRGISIFIQDVRENDLKVLDDWKENSGKDYLLIMPDGDLDIEFPTGLRFERQRMSDMMITGERKANEILGPAPPAPMAGRSSTPRGFGMAAKKTRQKPHPKTKSISSRCKGITMEGKRCKNKAKARSVYCHMHGHV